MSIGNIAKGIVKIGWEVIKSSAGTLDAAEGNDPNRGIYGRDESYTRAYNQKIAERANKALKDSGY